MPHVKRRAYAYQEVTGGNLWYCNGFDAEFFFTVKNGGRHLLYREIHCWGKTTIFNDTSSGCDARCIPSWICPSG